ncbi:hypothetical protein EDB73_108123 [Vibrio crassostreae]|nr:hypothetical protein EDB73_108123 [Vibrio crassostreae]
MPCNALEPDKKHVHFALFLPTSSHSNTTVQIYSYIATPVKTALIEQITFRIKGLRSIFKLEFGLMVRFPV